MEEILYIKIEQNIPVKKRALTYKDIASLYCTNKKIVQKLEQETFYTLPADCNQKTMFTISKVYEGIHKIYPNLKIENVGEKDFIVDLELPDGKEKSKTREYVKTAFVALIVFFGAAFTIMTFNEDVNVSNVFDKVYKLIMGTSKQGGSSLEISYAIGLPLGILVFYNHFRRRKIKDDPTPIQVEMCTYEEQVNKAMIKTASREGHTIDSN
ncbi:MAG: stage V sporulation protein AA [Eubacterium sp.]|nr:stage V sporulation protein AA [Eubacterium sp.]